MIPFHLGRVELIIVELIHVFRLVSIISKSTNINILILFELRWKTGHRSWECCQDDMRMYCLCKIACVMTGRGVLIEEEALSMRWFRRWITRWCAMTIVPVGRMGGHIDCFNGAIWLSLSAMIPLHLGRVELIIVELTLMCYDW